MNTHELADTPRRCGTGIGRRLDRRDIATHDRGHEPGIDFLPPDKDDVRSLDHRVGGFNHADEAACFDEAERLAREFPGHAPPFYYAILPRAEISS